MELQIALEKLLDAMEVVKELNKDLKDLEQASPVQLEVNEIQKQLKLKKQELASDPDIEDLRDERDTAKERMQMLKEILVAQMQESEATEVTFKGKKAILAKTMKIEKAGAAS